MTKYSKAELEQRVADLEEELAQANEDHDLASARLVTLERESNGKIELLDRMNTDKDRRIADLERALAEMIQTASLLALRSVDPGLYDRVSKAVAK